MSVEIFMSLLLGCSIFTNLITEALKKRFGKANSVAGVTSLIVGVFSYSSYCVFNSINLNATSLKSCIALCILSWLCAMLGYDKVIQSITQLKR